ncbi:MAG: nucleoside-diphosphate kinase [Candidatus Brocadia sp.]|nr:nucleoside-diphosphate kinase [Candidatus Brocadia sp.]UJS18853.1 MAG: nucleoside-diphosphate kinase [Candidatus Jettenia sp.]
MEKTLIILKPDAVQRRLLGKIIARFEEKGFQILGMKMMQIPESLARQHYAPHEGKDFFEPLIRYTTSAPVVVMALKGKNAIEIVRKMMGATFGSKAEPGTIRGDYAISNRFNLIHGSDSPASAEKEIGIFFKKEELFEYNLTDIQWVYDMSTGDIV